MRYNLFTNNCADVACEVMMASLNDNSRLYHAFKKTRDGHIHPGIMHDKLKAMLF